jgi:hypothetical protein
LAGLWIFRRFTLRAGRWDGSKFEFGLKLEIRKISSIKSKDYAGGGKPSRLGDVLEVLDL